MDEALQQLQGTTALPPAEQVDRYEALHRRLHDILVDTGGAGTSTGTTS